MPLILLRNLCDALVNCETTSDWIHTLHAAHWPFESYNLTFDGSEAPATDGCTQQLPFFKAAGRPSRQ